MKKLYGQKYSLPVKQDTFIDVGSGEVVPAKEVTFVDQLRMHAQKDGSKVVISDPKRGCNKCYGTGRTGRNSNGFIPCPCIFRDDPKYKAGAPLRAGKMTYLNRNFFR